MNSQNLINHSGVAHPPPFYEPNIGPLVNDQLVVDTRGLTKLYCARVAVDHLDLRVRRGEVYGFLGPNGAGKTTTLRMLLGLVQPTSGTALTSGHRPGSPASLTRLGALIETPAFYPYLSGWDNLRVLALHAGVPTSRVSLVLEQVGLADRGKDAFKTYSLGMKQRLGVAAALLKDPELLILDEPTNGLDPAGMAEMRSLIRSLGQGDRTVLLSSHLMAEVEQVCDRVGVIREGRLVAEGTVEELRGQGRLRICAEPLAEARKLVSQLAGVAEVQISEGRLRITVDPAEAPRINRMLVNAGIAVSEIFQERASLEKIFLELTQDQGVGNVE